MDKKLTEIVRLYGTKDHKEVSAFLSGLEKNELSSVITDLLTEYFNDKNSSFLREFILVSINGFTSNKKKIGYNGYRKNSIAGKQEEYCEAKPQNIITQERTHRKLNGGGNFTDYTWKKFERHKKENPVMLIGGFIDGRLVYSFKFAFNSPRFTKRLAEQLQAKFPSGDQEGYYLRSAGFSLKHYEEVNGLETMVFLSKPELDKLREHLTVNLHKFLIDQANFIK